jgi:DNA polymerase
MSANATDPSTVLHLDYETRSRCDLLACGAYKYAADPSTEILCMAWAFDDEEPAIWLPGQPFPQRVAEHFAAGARASIHAHNANFERLITRHVLVDYDGAPAVPPLEAWYCTATQARARALPGNLDDLARCLGGPQKKDRRGKELIQLLSIPQKDTGEFREDADLLAEMYAYCLQDVRVERAVSKMTPMLSEREHRDWVVSEMVNDAGLLVDVDFARAAVQYADAETAEINARLAEVTGGKITSAKQFARLKDLVLPFMEADERIRKAMTRVETDRREGVEKRRIVLDKDARAKLLALAEDEPGFLPPEILEVLELTDAAGKSSVSKFGNMVLRAGADGRVRGAYIASGAGQTGRFSSVGLQLHNFPRNCAKDPGDMRSKVLAGVELDSVMADLASMLRPSILAAPGNILVWGDWSAIEARVLPWLSGDLGGDEVLQIFRTNDADPSLPDIYKVEYGRAYGIAPTAVAKDQRQIGKVIVLSLGYQGGVKAFQAMARNYKVKIDDIEAARLRDEWRANNPWAPKFWRALEKAAAEAMRYPGMEFQAGRLVYCRPGPDAPLYCLLPSGRVLSYPQPVMEEFEGAYGPETRITAIKAQWKPKQGSDEWGRIQLYGGLTAENATQAVAADVLRDAMAKLVEDGWVPPGHTHDEIILEVREAEGPDARIELAAVMLEVPEWAPGLPLACEVSSGRRYSK